MEATPLVVGSTNVAGIAPTIAAAAEPVKSMPWLAIGQYSCCPMLDGCQFAHQHSGPVPIANAGGGIKLLALIGIKAGRGGSSHHGHPAVKKTLANYSIIFLHSGRDFFLNFFNLTLGIIFRIISFPAEVCQ